MKTRDVYLVIGFHTDVGAMEIERAIRKFLVEMDINQKEVSAKFGISLLLFSRDEINSVNVQSKSAEMVAFNLIGVAEPCAILGATRNNTKCRFVKRKSFDRKITLAVVF
jgi:cobalamin biosynthesis protein CbiG